MSFWLTKVYLSPKVKYLFDDGVLHEFMFMKVLCFSKWFILQNYVFPICNNYGIKKLKIYYHEK